jgi:2-polyprenyl-6-methoxyphenol hydroxylase-like FAD-dependent oxidoreductase
MTLSLITHHDILTDEVLEADTAGRAGRRTSVLVVGAGPTGLLLAAELGRRAVPCHLIDARPAPLHWDRATVVQPRSLEVFTSLGLVDRFLERYRRLLHAGHR